MSSLPLISHHLFVAAVGHGGRAQARRTRNETSYIELAAQPGAARLEVAGGASQKPAPAARRAAVPVKAGAS